MGKITVNAGFYPDPVPFFNTVITGTLHVVKGAVAKETVKLLKSLMTGIVLALPVFKKPARIIHFLPLIRFLNRSGNSNLLKPVKTSEAHPENIVYLIPHDPVTTQPDNREFAFLNAAYGSVIR